MTKDPELKVQSPRPEPGDLPAPVLELDGVCVGYRDKSILEDIRFRVQPGEFLGLVGPNGCGKTTLVKTILKTIRPSKGVIRIMGRDIRQMSGSDMARRTAAVLQTIDPAAMTVRAYVLLGRLPFFRRYQFFETQNDLDLADRYMALTGICHLADARVTEISGGERQLAAIARALTQEPALLIMDEPTSHLDITHQARILDLMHCLKEQLALTILMVLHDLNLAAEYADRLVLLDKSSGRIFSAGSPKTVLTESAIRQVYQTRVVVHPSPVTQNPWIFLKKQSIGDTPES